MCFIEHHFEQKQHRDYIMKVIINSAQSKDKEIRLYAMQCFVRAAEFHYVHIAPYFEEIWNVRFFLFFIINNN